MSARLPPPAPPQVRAGRYRCQVRALWLTTAQRPSGPRRTVLRPVRILSQLRNLTQPRTYDTSPRAREGRVLARRRPTRRPSTRSSLVPARPGYLLGRRRLSSAGRWPACRSPQPTWSHSIQSGCNPRARTMIPSHAAQGPAWFRRTGGPARSLRYPPIMRNILPWARRALSDPPARSGGGYLTQQMAGARACSGVGFPEQFCEASITLVSLGVK